MGSLNCQAKWNHKYNYGSVLLCLCSIGNESIRNVWGYKQRGNWLRVADIFSQNKQSGSRYFLSAGELYKSQLFCNHLGLFLMLQQEGCCSSRHHSTVQNKKRQGKGWNRLCLSLLSKSKHTKHIPGNPAAQLATTTAKELSGFWRRRQKRVRGWEQ